MSTSDTSTLIYRLKCFCFLSLGVLLIVLSLTVAWMAVPIHQAMVNVSGATSSLPTLTSSITLALKGKHANGDDGLIVQTQLLVSNLREMANASKQVSQTVNAVTKAQKQKADELTTQSIELIAAGTRTVDKLGATIDSLTAATDSIKSVVTSAGVKLNDGVLPQLTATLADTSTTLKQFSGPDGLLTTTTATMKSAGEVLADPDIKTTLSHISSTTAETSRFMAAGADTMQIVRDDLKPTKATLRSVILNKGIAALPQFLIDWFLRKWVPEQAVVTVKK